MSEKFNALVKAVGELETSVLAASDRMLPSPLDYTLTEDDRAGWPKGPWDKEPDSMVWKTKADLPGMILRSTLGALCGYVAVDKSHPLYKQRFGAVVGIGGVHGGLTFSGYRAEPGDAMVEDEWWFGFDCAHFMDFVPGLTKFNMPEYAKTTEYRDFAYVKDEVEQLARELAQWSKDK